MKERRWRKYDSVRRRHIFEGEMTEGVWLVIHLDDDDFRRFRFIKFVQDRPLDIATGAWEREVDDIGLLPSLREVLLDGGGAEAKLCARRPKDGDVDRLGSKWIRS